MSRFSQAQFLLSAAAPEQFPPDRGAEVAFAGRSNAGKSSAINSITGRGGLARTSKTPGRTRLVNFFEVGTDRRIVDLPGYGYASVPDVERRTWSATLERLRGRFSLRGLFLVVDIRRGVADADEALIDWADTGTRAIHVLLAKSDKLSRAQCGRALKEATAKLGARATVQLFSAPAKTGIEAARGVLERWLEQRE